MLDPPRWEWGDPTRYEVDKLGETAKDKIYHLVQESVTFDEATLKIKKAGMAGYLMKATVQRHIEWHVL